MVFLEEVDAALGEKVTSTHCNIMYLADFFEKINKVRLKLQGYGVTLVQCKAVIHSLTSRLDLCRQSMGRRQFSHFPQLTKVIYYFSVTTLNKYIIIGPLLL